MHLHVFLGCNHVCLDENRDVLGTTLLSIVFAECMPARRYRGKFNFFLSLSYPIADL